MILQGKVIMISGGASGIGQACALAYAQEGAIVVIIDKDTTALHTMQALLPGPHSLLQADVAKGAEVEQAMKTILQNHGRLDAIHNNAGVAQPSKPLHETTEEEWELVMHVNVKSIYTTTLYCIAAL